MVEKELIIINSFSYRDKKNLTLSLGVDYSSINK